MSSAISAIFHGVTENPVFSSNSEAFQGLPCGYRAMQFAVNTIMSGGGAPHDTC